jgi:3'-5' exoribonuclease
LSESAVDTAVSGNRPKPITSLAIGDELKGAVFLLSAVEERAKKNGDVYYSIQLSDRSGTLPAIMWDGHEAIVQGRARATDFVRVYGKVARYGEQMQATLTGIELVPDSEIDTSLYLPTSPRSRGEMEVELDAWIGRVTNPDCRRLLELMLRSAKLREAYCTAPAAVRIHQAYLHGLLEHTLNVLRIADHIAALYEPVNRDILITGGLLHDIGKVQELSWGRTISYTTKGRLCGHISLGAAMVDRAITALRKVAPFDDRVENEVVHLILSHHGKLEYGSPVRPQTREAQIFHYADYTDAYMTVFADETRKAVQRGEEWTPFNRMFDSFLFAGSISGAALKVPSSEDLVYTPPSETSMEAVYKNR